MKIELTLPMQKAMTPEVMYRIERALQEFPELEPYTLKVGLILHSDDHGSAEARNFVIRLNTRARSGTTYFTIAHELTHLLQKPGGLGLVPYGEVQCDIYALARSALFTDDMPTYLPGLKCNKRAWVHHAAAVRELCLQAIEVRKVRRTYITWLGEAIDRYFSRPSHSQADQLALNFSKRS
jgi:hypothetical protein